jgi:hypothetical protein
MQLKSELLCYVYGCESEWTAICVDLDLRVEASSQTEVMNRLKKVVHSYVEDARKEAPADCMRLLSRSSPWHVRFHLWALHQLYLLRRSGPHDRSVSAVAVPCPA